MKTKIERVHLLPMDDACSAIKDACVLIEDARIAYAGAADAAPAFEADRVIDGRSRICMPGLVNAHTHLSMSLLRGLGSDLRLMDWLERIIFPTEDRMDAEAAYYGALLTLCESMRFGVTSVLDMYMFEEHAAKAVAQSGMRARLSRGVVGDTYDDPAARARIEESLALAERWHGAENGRIRVAFAPHAEYTTAPELLRALRGMGRPYGFHIHASETLHETQGCMERRGCTPISYFNDLGLLGEDTVLAHCVHVTDADIEILAKTGTTVAHCPISNMKLASGVAPVVKMLEAGVRVAMGTDGAASNNTANMFEELRITPLLAKAVTLDPTAMPVSRVLAMATHGGARAVGNPDVGRLVAGAPADLILLDADGLSARPIPDARAHVVFAATGSDVSLTMVDGRVLYEDGAFLTVDVAEMQRGFDAALKRMGLGA